VYYETFLNIKKLDTNTTEYFKTQLYIDQATSKPWNIFFNIREQIGLDISSSSSNSLIHHMQIRLLIKEFIETIKQEFDKQIYGMENVKNEIINYVYKFITNPLSQRNNIALFGSAGGCKTKFITVLSSVLKLPIKIVSLGGMKDSSYLLGHSQTYQDSKCNNNRTTICYRTS
jgi:ATP-dependent Lon protease